MTEKRYLDDRVKNPPQVHGTPMSAEAKGRAAVAAQVTNLKQRAEVMNMSVAQLIQLQDAGQVANPLPVPTEFRAYLADQENKQRAAVTTVQRQQPQPPQVNLPPDHPLYQQAMALAQQQAQPPQVVQPHISERVAPPVAPPLYDQQLMQQYGPPPSDADLASLDALMGASESAGIIGSEYEAAMRYVQKTTPPPQPKPETPRTFDVETLPPNALPPRQERPSAVSQLRNPVWRSVDSLLLWESFCTCVMEADAHMLRDPSQRKTLIQRLAKFQAAVEEQDPDLALPYLQEIEKRARHRAILTRRLTALGVHPITLTRMAQDYQKLLGPINEVVVKTVANTINLERFGISEEPTASAEQPVEQPVEEQPSTGKAAKKKG